MWRNRKEWDKGGLKRQDREGKVEESVREELHRMVTEDELG